MALTVVKGDKTLAKLAQPFDLHPNQITQWRSQLLENAAGAFGVTESGPPPVDVIQNLDRAPPSRPMAFSKSNGSVDPVLKRSATRRRIASLSGKGSASSSTSTASSVSASRSGS